MSTVVSNKTHSNTQFYILLIATVMIYIILYYFLNADCMHINYELYVVVDKIWINFHLVHSTSVAQFV